jgi:hypothetical protein
MELYQANAQWKFRPDDERYPTVEAMHEAACAYRASAVERNDINLSTLRVQEVEGEVNLVGKGGVPSKLSNWAFGQVAKFAGAPADYLRKMPAADAATNLNRDLSARLMEKTLVNLLFHVQGGYRLRAFNSDQYARIWNNEVTQKLLDHYISQGWVPATPTFNQQSTGKDTALYVSDHDMFAFIVHPERVVREPGNPAGLLRGMIAINSEVGARKLVKLRFLFREMCGNHIIWGAEEVEQASVRHVGNIRERFQLWAVEATRYMDSSAADDEAKIQLAQRKLIAGTKEEVLDALFGKRSLPLSRKTIEAGYDAVVPDQDGRPNSYWGLAQGLTRHSQTIPYADQRTEVDKAAGRLLALAF